MDIKEADINQGPLTCQYNTEMKKYAQNTENKVSKIWEV